MGISQTFGDKRTFAVRYRPTPDHYNYSPENKMAICHLIINDHLIGNEDEECFLPTWIFNLTNRRRLIAENRHSLFPREFEDLTNREIFEIILKVNQLENEFYHDFLYLPQLDNEIWSRHSFTLDETIDGYLIYFYVKDGQITFLIEDLTDNNFVSGQRTYKFHFHELSLESYFNTVDETTNFLLKQFPYLRDNVSNANA